MQTSPEVNTLAIRVASTSAWLFLEGNKSQVGRKQIQQSDVDKLSVPKSATVRLSVFILVCLLVCCRDFVKAASFCVTDNAISQSSDHDQPCISF